MAIAAPHIEAWRDRLVALATDAWAHRPVHLRRPSPAALRRQALTCPAAPCAEGVGILGMVGASGNIGFLDPAPRVSAAFVEAAELLHPPETRFRFTDRCREHACAWWAGQSCGLVDLAVADEVLALDPAAELPSCGIRPTCRWYSQSGARACAVCPSVVADLHVEVVAITGDVAPGGGAGFPSPDPAPPPLRQPLRERVREYTSRRSRVGA